MYEAWFMQKSLSNQVNLCNQCEPLCEICVGQSFALKRTSRLHGILMKWLDFAHEYLPNKNYLDCIYSLDYDIIQKCKKKIWKNENFPFSLWSFMCTEIQMTCWCCTHDVMLYNMLWFRWSLLILLLPYDFQSYALHLESQSHATNTTSLQSYRYSIINHFGSNIAQLFQNINQVFPTITVQTISDLSNCTIVVLSNKLSQ